MKTRTVKQNEIKQEWHLFDLSGVRLGRAAQEIAKLLLGKGKVTISDYLLTGDKVVVINAAKVDYYFTKGSRKKYYSYSGYPGGLSDITLEELLKKDPVRIIRNAVHGMLPKNKIGRQMMKNLYIYPGTEYKETAQQPKLYKFK